MNSGGGSWYPPTVDQATGTVYWGTGNPGPYPGTPQYPNGSSWPGANLYTDSTLALSLATGKLLWYHQENAHDILDHDFMLTMLVGAGSGQGAHPLVVGTGKAGVVVGMDPTTGKVAWSAPVGRARLHDYTHRPAARDHPGPPRDLRRGAHPAGRCSGAPSTWPPSTPRRRWLPRGLTGFYTGGRYRAGCRSRWSPSTRPTVTFDGTPTVAG